MRDAMLHHRVNKSSVKIQSLLKGLLVAKKYEHVYVKMRLTDNLELFDQQKGNRQENAQILIAYHMRRKLKWLREKRKPKESTKVVVKEVKKGV